MAAFKEDRSKDEGDEKTAFDTRDDEDEADEEIIEGEGAGEGEQEGDRETGEVVKYGEREK